ncbi:hypothetical protein HYQ00_gp50 [Arthrobacter phage TripleJ]|uniref:Uncharacterized protein n=1 Tax=Arthrobacter phage TripleJ TaxID=2599838 RepID=A0A5J6THS5_9CAUD|nr:hypothetical protein HYQ00_gp50 [Arthrobacter phage TripleJ]QFG09594.1 hypothetical protein PBI_TRIPLEJ_50 [Arthrobacter phage TripleJ]
MSAQFAMVDHEREQGMSLYFEDQYIALDTWDRKRGPGDHEILLDPRTVELLIEALTTMQADIRSRYQKAIEA